MLSDAALDAIVARHLPEPDGGEPPAWRCTYCSHADAHYWHDEPWPCDVIRVLTAYAARRIGVCVS